MRNYFMALVILSGVVVVGACNSANSKSTPTAQNTQKKAEPETVVADGARRITVAETQDLIKKGKAYIVDVRTQAVYDAGHIAGAKLIPAAEILNHVEELPRDKTIITYCSWPNEHTSAGAVVSLKTKKIENAAALLGGYAAWEREGLPIERKQ